MATSYKRKRNDELGSLTKLKTRSSSSGLSGYSGGGISKISSSSALSDLDKAKTSEETTIGNLNAYGKTEKEATDDRNFIEKGLGLKSNQGFFGDVFEVLGKPQQAIMGAGIDTNPFAGAWKGLSGQSHYTGEEVGHALGITNENSPQWLKTLTGFGLDMATDPLAYTNAPFEWAGTKIKGMAQKGYKAAASALSKTEKGSEIIKSLESAMDRMSSVTKSAFGLWKSEDFKGFKNDLLNKGNMSNVAKEGIAETMVGINDDVQKFAKAMHENPEEFAAERKALGLTKDSTEKETSKAISDDLMNAMEANKKESLSKSQVYNNLGKQNSEAGEGRFLVTGENPEEQANAIMDSVREDWTKANGRPLKDDELSFTNGYINAGPEVAAFLRRTKAGYDNIATRLNLFGIQGRLEGALQTLGRSGAVTFSMEDAAEQDLVRELISRFGSKAKVRFGAGTASVQLGAKEFKEFMQTGKAQEIFQGSKDLARSKRNLTNFQNLQERLQARIRATGLKGNQKVHALNEEATSLTNERIELWKQKEELIEERAKIMNEADKNKTVISKVDGENITTKDEELVFKKFKGIYNNLLEQMPGLHDIIPEEKFIEIATKFKVFGKGPAQASYGYSPHVLKNKETGKYVKAIAGEGIISVYMEKVDDLESAMIHELLHSIDGTLSSFSESKTGMGMRFRSGGQINADERFLDINGENIRVNGTFKTGAYYEDNIIKHITDEMYAHPNWWKDEIESLRTDDNIQRIFSGEEDLSHLSNKEFMKVYNEKARKMSEGKLSSFAEIEDGNVMRDVMEESGVWYNADTVDDYSLDYYQEQGKESIDEAINNYTYEEIDDILKAELEEGEYSEILQSLEGQGANERDVFYHFFDAESYITASIASKIGSFPRAITSGPSSEYWAEIVTGHLTGKLTENSARKYERFITQYSQDIMGVEVKVGRKIKVEKAEFNKKLAQNRAKERFNTTKVRKNKLSRERIIKRTHEELNKLDGSAQTIAEKAKSAKSKVNRQTNTINRIDRETDMNLTKDSTNGNLSAEMVKKTKVKTAVKLNGAGQKEVQQLNAELKRFRAFNDGNFYEVKMADSVLVDVSKDFQRIHNSLEGAKQQIYDMIEKTYAAEGTPLGDVLENLNVDGYMRHVINPDAMIYNEIKKLRSGGKLAGAKARELVGGLGDNATFFEKNWYGSATEINKKLGVELFNTNPIESMATLLQLLPQHFEVAHVFQGAFDTKLIRELGEEEVSSIIDLIEANRNEGMTAGAARANALKQILPKEFTMVDANVKQKLLSSFDFLEKGGAKADEIDILKQQIQKIDESQGMIIHKGMLNQIHRYGKQLRNQDIRIILDKVKKYFVTPFKSLATLSLGFHVRNNITNVTNAYLAGMNPTHYFEHFTNATRHLTTVERSIVPKLQRMVRSGGEDIKTIAGQLKWIDKNFTAEEKQLYNKMHEWQAKGVMGVNRFTGDLADILSGISKEGTSSKFGKGYKKATEASMKIGKLSDDASKIATYEWAKNTKAGKKVLASYGMKEPEEFSKFVFFDYSDLTSFESRYMKAIFPFYTWTRKNIEFQVKAFLKNSDRYIKMNKVITHWQDYMTDGNKDQMSSYDVEDMMIPISNSNGTTTMLKVSPGFLDVSDTFKNPLNKISPLIKAPLESWAGTNFFSGRSTDTGPFGQFSQEIFGDFGELGKGLRGEDYDKTKTGLVGGKIMSGKNAMTSIVNGQPTASSIAPSIFRETNNEDTEASNIQQRITQSRAYIQKLQQSGKTPDARLLPRNRGRSASNGYTRGGTKYNI